MKIGFCYDLPGDYDIDNNDLTYCDFISPEAASFVKSTIERSGHSVEMIGNHKKLLDLVNQQFNCDIILTAAEGYKSRNRESWISSIAELYGIRHIGTDTYGLVVTLDKILTKLIARHLGIPTPNFFEIENEAQIEKHINELKYPIIIKPYGEGSSMGVTIVNSDIEYTHEAEELLSKYKQKVICEEYLPGREIASCMYEKNEEAAVFGLVESILENDDIMPIYSSQIKRSGGCKKQKPQITSKQWQDIEIYSKRLFQYIDCHDYCRMDFRLDNNGVANLLEITPLPALAESASFISAGKLNNLEPTHIFETMIENACRRHEKIIT